MTQCGPRREAQQYAGQNPALAALLGFVDWDRGCIARKDKKYDEAAELLTRALTAGEHVLFYEDRADTYFRQKRYTDALADIAHALALVPEDEGALITRAWVLVALERYQDALTDVQVLSELDPTSDKLASFRQQQTTQRCTRRTSSWRRRRTWTAPSRGTRGRSSYLPPTPSAILAWPRLSSRRNDRVHALADFESAIRLDPRHFESYRNVDWLLAQRADWDGSSRTGRATSSSSPSTASLPRAGRRLPSEGR